MQERTNPITRKGDETMGISVYHFLTHYQTELRSPIKHIWRAETFNRRNELIQKFLENLKDHAIQEDQIVANARLSQTEKQKARRTLGTDTLRNLQWLKHVVLDVEKQDAGFKKRLYTISPHMRDEGRWQEIRKPLAGKSQAERDTRFLQAASRGN